MKTTIEIPAHTVQYFSDLATILQSDWKTLFENYLEILTFENRKGAALEAMEYAKSHEEAGHIADRAIAFLKENGEEPIAKETFLLTYQRVTGEIDAADYLILSEAGKILDGSLSPAQIPEESNDDEGEDWKKS